MRILMLFISLLFLSGCAGLAVGTYGTFESQKDSFSLSNIRLEQNYRERKSYSKDEVISLWGEPDQISINGSCEVLTYYDGYTWSGVGAFILVIPVPLILPSGHDETKIYFKNNQSIKLISEYGEVTGMVGYMCGSNECGFMAGSVNTEQTRTIPVTWCE